MTLIGEYTGSNEPKCHSFPGANICARVLHFRGVCSPHITERCLGWQEWQNQLLVKQWPCLKYNISEHTEYRLIFFEIARKTNM